MTSQEVTCLAGPEDEDTEPEHKLLVQLVQHHCGKTVVFSKL